MRGGRKLSDVWDHFHRSNYKKGFQATCKKCSAVVLGKKDLMWQHLRGCSLVEFEVQEESKRHLSNDKKRCFDDVDETQNAAVSSKESELERKPKQAKFFVTSKPMVAHAEQEQLDSQLTRFFVTSNIPFQVCFSRPLFFP